MLFLVFEKFHSIEQTGNQEIEPRLHPKHLILKLYLLEVGAHGIDADKALNAVRGGEQVGEILPKFRHVGARPHHPRQKEQYHAEKDADDDACVALSDERTHCHAERYGR